MVNNAKSLQGNLYNECKYLDAFLKFQEYFIMLNLSFIHCREPEMKRTICKQCGLVLKPGTSCELDISDEHSNECSIKCSKCGSIKRFIVNPKYNLWIDTKRND